MELALCREEAIGISVVDYDLARVRELLPDALTGFADLRSIAAGDDDTVFVDDAHGTAEDLLHLVNDILKQTI